MRYNGQKAEGVKIAYIGGGSRGWAWNLMSDLAVEEALSGSVFLYDIDREAAHKNEVIGSQIPGNKFTYHAVDTINEALSGADFVVISILPGTFDEMESDVHCGEKYGIYQSVGDTVGIGGYFRALRTIPMFVEIAEAIKRYAPDSWVINYTNPMTVCVRTLYSVFPQIKAFGCCHEVFGTQKLLAQMLKEYTGDAPEDHKEIKVNVKGINHFTWLDSAYYRNTDLFPLYRRLAEEYGESGYGVTDRSWMNQYFICHHKVKFDLFRRFGCIAAAGDRHLAEFCPRGWYLKDPATVEQWGFALTPVSYRKGKLAELLEKSEQMACGGQKFTINPSGEEGVRQMKALLGLGDLVTNVNLPNVGQIPNLPLGAVVETNAVFTAGGVRPVMAGPLSDGVARLTAPISYLQEQTVEAGLRQDKDFAFSVFLQEPSISDLSKGDTRRLFDEMFDNTKKYLWEE